MCPDCENKSFKKSLILVLVLGAFVIGFKSYASGTMGDHGKMKKMANKTRESLNEQTQKQIIAILEANEKLHGAFFEYDGKKVEAEANNVNSAISKLTDEKIGKLLKFSQTKLGEIKASSDRDKNNQNYHLVSMALIHIVNKYDVGPKYNAYSCPMVKKKWVQNSNKMDKVHNPYAPEMPHCGSKDSSY